MQSGISGVEAPALPGPSVKATPLRLDPRASLDDAFAAVIGGCLDHFCANAARFRRAGQPESVHQMRVALRRLRAAIGLSKKDFPCAELILAAAQAKLLAGKLGVVRDWDVFHDRLSEPRAAAPGEAGFYALIDMVELRRAEAAQEARIALDSPRTHEFLDGLRTVVERRAWSNGGVSTQEGSARVFAARSLTRLRKRALTRCDGLADLPAHDRHQARIALKKARYGAEFFESLFDAPSRPWLHAISHLQESLGSGTDVEMALRLLDRLDVDDNAAPRRAIGFCRGWWTHALAEITAAAHESGKSLRKVRPFWT